MEISTHNTETSAAPPQAMTRQENQSAGRSTPWTALLNHPATPRINQFPDEHPCQTARRLILLEMYPVLPEWQQRFKERYNWDVNFELEGSLKIGSLVGPKNSLNPERHGAKVVDVDISLRLPDHLNPEDPEVIKAISEITGTKHWQNFSWDYWSVNITAGVYFQYLSIPVLEELIGTQEVEIEMVVRTNNSTVAFADYWNQIFTPQEIEQQIREKKEAATVGKDAYLAVKAQHDVNARYRIMFGWKHGALKGMPEAFAHLLDDWYVWGWRGTDNVWEGVMGVMPQPPGAYSYAWLAQAWDQASRLNSLQQEASNRGLITAINGDLECRLRALVDGGSLRPADACNVLMTARGIKPTFLVVQPSEKACRELLECIRAQHDNDLHIEVHMDPDTEQHYFIGCRTPQKIALIKSLTENSCSKPSANSITSLLSPSASYHRQLGVFLDVPECCLVERAVMPDEADSIFHAMKEGVDTGRLSADVHYSPHLPCSCECEKTSLIGKGYRAFIETHLPDYAKLFHTNREQKPLYLY